MIASSSRVDAVVIGAGGSSSGERCLGGRSPATSATEHITKRDRPIAFIRCSVLLLECSTTLMMVVIVIVEKQTLPPENRIYDHSSSPTPFITTRHPPPVAVPRPWNALSRRASVGTHLVSVRPKTDSLRFAFACRCVGFWFCSAHSPPKKMPRVGFLSRVLGLLNHNQELRFLAQATTIRRGYYKIILPTFVQECYRLIL